MRHRGQHNTTYTGVLSGASGMHAATLIKNGTGSSTPTAAAIPRWPVANIGNGGTRGQLVAGASSTDNTTAKASTSDTFGR